MKPDIKLFVEAVGAISEVAKLLRDNLIENGFTRQEAVSICSNFVATSFRSGKSCQEDI